MKILKISNKFWKHSQLSEKVNYSAERSGERLPPACSPPTPPQPCRNGPWACKASDQEPESSPLLLNSSPCAEGPSSFQTRVSAPVLLKLVHHMAPGQFHCHLCALQGGDRVFHSAALEGCMQAKCPASPTGTDPWPWGTNATTDAHLYISSPRQRRASLCLPC